jgi:hypothetical protein
LVHEKTSLHQERLKSKSRQMLISEPRNTAEKYTFALDLCSALVAPNIPWAKLDCPQFKVFLEKYCDKHIPDRTTLSKTYLPKCYANVSMIIPSQVYKHLIFQ